MAVFDRLPPRVPVSVDESVQRLTRGALDAPGRRNSRFVTASGTVALEDDDVYGDSTSGAVALTLPLAGLVTDREFRFVRWKGGSAVTVTCTGTDALATGGTSVTLSAIGDVARLKAVVLPSGVAAWMPL